MRLLVLDQNQHPEDFRDALEPKFPDLSIHAFSEEEGIEDIIEEIDIVLCVRISDDLVKKAAKLQWIHTMMTGVDYFLNLPSLRKEVLLSSSRGIHAPQMSEMAFLFMLGLNRDFPRIARNQEQRVWERWPARLLDRKKVAILGVGACGEEIARKCKAFGMTVYGINRTKREIESVDYAYGPEELHQVIGEVDYFINVVPSTPQTRKMIGAKELNAMKPTAFFINIGRGDTVDEEALIHALKTGKIAGAGLDVFCTTPLPKDHPLWGMKNVIVTSHVGGFSDIYVEQALTLFEKNLRRFLRGERRNLINLVER